jgi:hypothetical protein
VGAVRGITKINGAGSFNQQAYQDVLREAAMKAVKAEDVQEMVAKQLELAKSGDRHALKWVTDVILGAGKPLSVRATQHNYYEADPPPAPPALPHEQEGDDYRPPRIAGSMSDGRRTNRLPPDPVLIEAEPTDIRGGTRAKVEVMAQRRRAGQKLFNAADGPNDEE